MRVTASDEVRSYIAANGGVLYVNAHRHKCCSGALTLLDASTREPADAKDYYAFDGDGFPVCLRTGGVGEPDELVVEMKGLRRRHPVVYWNGCAFKI